MTAIEDAEETGVDRRNAYIPDAVTSHAAWKAMDETSPGGAEDMPSSAAHGGNLVDQVRVAEARARSIADHARWENEVASRIRAFVPRAPYVPRHRGDGTAAQLDDVG